MTIEYAWRGSFENHEVNRLHAEGFGHAVLDDDWQQQVERHSLGWVCARHNEHLSAFYFDTCGFTPTTAGLIKL